MNYFEPAASHLRQWREPTGGDELYQRRGSALYVRAVGSCQSDFRSVGAQNPTIRFICANEGTVEVDRNCVRGAIVRGGSAKVQVGTAPEVES